MVAQATAMKYYRVDKAEHFDSACGCAIFSVRYSCMWINRMRLRLVITLGITAILTGGCASNYEPRPDLGSVDTVGVVLPEEPSENLEAEDVIQLHNLTKGEGRLKNSAVGAGAGAAVGTAAGIGAGAIIGCTATAFMAPLCWTVVLVGGAVIGGGTGAIAGATVDTQEQVVAAPVHLYEVNTVLPALQREYLTNADLEKRALRLVRQQIPATNFMPAEPDGDRYRLVTTENTGGSYSDVNLVLSDLRVQFAGKAENDPNVTLRVYTRWSLTKYDASTNLSADWDLLTGTYQSEKHQLSEWLADDGILLMSQVDEGLEVSLTSAFAALAPETDEQQWARISPEDSF
jgi:hypothetical protein